MFNFYKNIDDSMNGYTFIINCNIINILLVVIYGILETNMDIIGLKSMTDLRCLFQIN